MHPIEIPGFENQQLAVKVSRMFGNPKLYVNGQPAPAGSKRGDFLVRRDDGSEETVTLKVALPDYTPVVLAGGQTIRLAEPLTPFQWVWCASPLVLIIFGGLIGAVVGVMATSANTQIFRSQKYGVLKYGLTAMVSLLAITLWVIVGSAIQGARR